MNSKSDISLHPGGIDLTLNNMRKADLPAGSRLLDIGCGTGASLAALRDAFSIIPYGADVSETVLAIAGSAHPEISFTQCDAASLPYPDGFFDAVMMECVLTLFDDPDAALEEASRVLKSGGKLMISTLSSPEPEELTARITKHGFRLLSAEDNKNELTDYVIESILEYGSLDERIAAETALTGASVFDCGCSIDPKSITYYSFLFQKL